jgi:undecaprenyl-diphosphatase
MKYKVPILICLAVLAIRLPILGLVGLGDSEAYYWAWSKHLDLSYFDHPPAVAYTIRAGTEIFGENPFGVRIVPTVLTTASLFIVYLAGEALGGRLAGLITMIVLMCKPLYMIAGVSAAPDAPKSFFISLALLFFIKARRKDDETPGSTASDGYVILAGLFFGLGFLSKYSALMLLPGLLFVLLLRHNRHWWKRPSLYGGFLVCLLSALPVLVWNMRHTWNSVVYHLVSRQSAAGFSLANLGKLLGGQLAYFSPFILIGFVFAAVKAWRERKRDPLPFEIVLIGVPNVLFFYLIILVTPNAEPHWPLGGYIYMSVVLGWMIARAAKPEQAAGAPTAWKRWWGQWGKGLRGVMYASVVYSLIIVVLAHLAIATPLFVSLAPASYNPKLDITNELYGREAIGPRIEARYAELSDPGAFLLGYHYTICSQLMFATGGRIETRCLSPRKSAWDFLPGGSGPFEGRNAIYVRDNRYKKEPQEMYVFDSCTSLEKVPFVRGGKKVREWEIYSCKGYRGLR